MSNEPENLVLQLLRGIRADLTETKAEMKADMHSLRAEMKSDMHSLRADVASDLLVMQAKLEADIKKTRKELGEQISGLRSTVVDYHASVIGRGILISEQEERIRRIEKHLNLPALGGH